MDRFKDCIFLEDNNDETEYDDETEYTDDKQ